jgi:hypothetical protein
MSTGAIDPHRTHRKRWAPLSALIKYAISQTRCGELQVLAGGDVSALSQSNAHDSGQSCVFYDGDVVLVAEDSLN